MSSSNAVSFSLKADFRRPLQPWLLYDGFPTMTVVQWSTSVFGGIVITASGSNFCFIETLPKQIIWQLAAKITSCLVVFTLHSSQWSSKYCGIPVCCQYTSFYGRKADRPMFLHWNIYFIKVSFRYLTKKYANSQITTTAFCFVHPLEYNPVKAYCRSRWGSALKLCWSSFFQIGRKLHFYSLYCARIVLSSTSWKALGTHKLRTYSSSL